MHLVLISAANMRHARENSTSTRICSVLQSIAEEEAGLPLTTDLIRLVDYALQPCDGCGACYTRGQCAQDAVFNDLYRRICQADALFVVAAHYAPIPARLCMLLEKMEQIAFLPRFHEETRHSPLYHRPAGIVAHGGGTEAIYRAYRGVVIDTIWNALSWPIEMDIVGAGEEWPRGVAVPIHTVTCAPDAVFPIQEYDWDDIRARVTPLARGVLEHCRQRAAA